MKECRMALQEIWVKDIARSIIALTSAHLFPFGFFGICKQCMPDKLADCITAFCTKRSMPIAKNMVTMTCPLGHLAAH